jgi:RNA polymerase sigma factor (sigma-70 family)
VREQQATATSMSDESQDRDLLRDDAACREAFRRGDRAAMTRVYLEYRPFVEMMCCRGVGTFRGFFRPADQDDAIQAVFLAAFEERTRSAYDGLRPYGAFLRGVAHNVLRRMLEKRAQFERPVPAEHAREVREAGQEDAVVESEARAFAQGMRDSLDDPVEREIFDRYFIDGLAEESLAKRLGLTRYRTRKIIARLHRRMKRAVRGSRG